MMTSKQFIIVADDEIIFSSIYRVKLTQEGYEVFVAENGEITLSAARQKKPHLILLDLIMPVKDGFETLAELKKDHLLKDIPVMVVSNLGQEEDIKKAKDLGAIDYFVKTNITISEMIQRVNQFLSIGGF